MALQNSLFTFTGKLGNVIGYRRNGKAFLRSMPETVRQTPATRRASQRFGMASRKAALIRKAFYGSLDIHPDGEHGNRLTTALIPSAGNDMNSMTGFRFNQQTGTDRFFALPPTLSADGILHIPPQALPAFRNITALEVKVIAIRIDSATRRVAGSESAVLIVDTRESFSGAAVSVDVPGKGTLLVTLQVRGMRNHIPSGNKKHLAADIVAVQPPQPLQVIPGQAYLPRPTSQHRRMSQLRSMEPTTSADSFPDIIQRE